jgi:uncharacterized membrane protein YhaH (DUF805 family)
MDWYLTVLKKYAVFSGRARRREYWTFTLVNILIGIALGIITFVVPPLRALGHVYSLVLLIPSLAVFVRRLHDTGRSGWWFFIGFIPLVGAILLLLFLALDSEPEHNQYGPNPKAA